MLEWKDLRSMEGEKDMLTMKGSGTLKGLNTATLTSYRHL